jgi:sulfoxide reductase heme-binding subunit YedZ
MDTPARTALKTQSRWTSATLTRAAVHLAGLFPLAELAYHAAAQQLTVNPIQFIEQFFGLAALNLLALSLAVTPLITLTGYKTLGRHSRALGLYTFLYFSLHLLVFIGLDYSFDFSEILRLTAEKPFILAGAAAGLLLTALALTSFNYWKRLLRKNWKRLHRGVYLIGLLAVLHYAWALKGSLTTLSGDILRPLLMGLLILTLLALRLPPVKQAVLRLRRQRTAPIARP